MYYTVCNLLRPEGQWHFPWTIWTEVDDKNMEQRIMMFSDKIIISLSCKNFIWGEYSPLSSHPYIFKGSNNVYSEILVSKDDFEYKWNTAYLFAKQHPEKLDWGSME